MARNPECDGLRGGLGNPAVMSRPALEAEGGNTRSLGDAALRPGAYGASLVHDLNNLLTVVLGSVEQLRRQHLDDRGQVQLDRASWGARQAGLLARQLLASARGETGPELLDLNRAVGTFGAMIGGVVGDGVGLAVELAPTELPARLDPSQLELALLNLVRNAADAMPGGGTVVIRTAGPRMDGLGDQCTVEIAVSDTGTGMAPGITGQASDAFFTTKGRQGTGLGLWMVQRFATEAGGKLDVETAPGRGTTVRLVLPRATGG